MQEGIDKVIIIGGGFIGLELCEAFRAMWGVEVDLIELQDQVLSGSLDAELARLVEKELTNQGINLRLGCGCYEILEENDKVCIFDNAGEMFQADRIVLAAGVQPNSGLAKSAGLEVGVTGGIKINDQLQTSDPDIYAAGDCVELNSAVDGRAGSWQVGSLATRMGRIVGDNICNGDSRFRPIVGTVIFKLFDLTVGTAGMTKTECVDQGYDIKESWGTFHDRLDYYPGSSHINAKLLYDKSNGRLLGFQAISRGHLTGTLNMASDVIHRGGTIDDLHDIEHAYAPPYSLPLDPLHYLAFIIENSRTAGIKLVSPGEFPLLHDDVLILDVRIPAEIESRALNVGSKRKLEIPVEDLRSRLKGLGGFGPVVTVCQMGGRAWDAALMLRRAEARSITFSNGSSRASFCMIMNLILIMKWPRPCGSHFRILMIKDPGRASFFP